MTAKRMIALVAAVALLGLGLAAVNGWAISLGDILKVGGVALLVSQYDDQLDSFITSALGEREAARAAGDSPGFRLRIGTMIEVPRAALTAGAIAGFADFFSFGTNDLTQMTYALSRDDAGKFLPEYLESRLLEDDPFVSIDEEGIGALIEIAVERGRKAHPGLKLGLCGEHGGDAKSVRFCHRVGLDYVSCSPYRVPIARLAAAQAAVQDG